MRPAQPREVPGGAPGAEKLLPRGDPEAARPRGGSPEPSEATPLKGGTEEVSLLRHPVQWVQALSRSYSWRLIVMVVCSNHLLKGFVAGGGDEGLVGKPIEFIFGGMGIAAGRLQVLKAVAISPWALKPVLAVLSDAVPIMGYRRMPYVTATTLLALVGASLLGLDLVSGVRGVVACLFLIFLQVAAVDLLVEARQSEEVKQKARLGPEFFTFTWLGINVGQVAGVCLVGPVIHHFGPRLPYLLALPVMALVLWPTLGNFLGERPLPREERGCSLKLARKHPVLFSMTLLIGSLIIALMVATFHLSEGPLIVLALCFAAAVLGSITLFIRPEISGPVVFYFLLGLLSFNLDGALFYWYTDSQVQFPEGPHFTTHFYTTAIGMTTFLGIMAGFCSGDRLFRGWSYRSLLGVTILLRAATQLMMLPALFRWTPRMGVTDAAWILPVTFLDTMVFAWRWIPKQVMGAHLTPKGVEATALGLTAGTFNMAMILSSYCGAYLLHIHGVRPAGGVDESHMFQDLWKVQAIAALAPCLTLVLVPILVPAKLQTEPLIVERPDSATHCSLYERLRPPRPR